MKLIVFFWLLAGVAVAQPASRPTVLPGDSAALSFQEVVALDSALDTQAVLSRVLSWVSDTYRYNQTVVERYDLQKGLMIVKGQFTLTNDRPVHRNTRPAPLLVHHLLIVETQPGQCQARLTRFEPEFRGPSTALQPPLSTPVYAAGLEQQCLAILTSFKRQWQTP